VQRRGSTTPPSLPYVEVLAVNEQEGDDRWIPGPCASAGFSAAADHLSAEFLSTNGPSYACETGKSLSAWIFKPIRYQALHAADNRKRNVISKPSWRKAYGIAYQNII